MPSSEAPQSDNSSDRIVWLVSYDENDDREMTRPQIAGAIARGEIDAETIVWREGFEQWIAIAEVPSLSPLLPTSGETKDVGEVAPLGFLGTGLALKADTPDRKSVPPPFPRKSEPPKNGQSPTAPAVGARKSVPPPLPKSHAAEAAPDSDEAPMSVDPESLGPDSISEVLMSAQALPGARALSGGTFGVNANANVVAEGSVPVKAAAPAVAPAPLRAPTPAESATPPPDSEPPPSSGTPSLMSLATAPNEETQKVDDEILALGGATAPGLMPPPNIDVSDVERTAQNSLAPPNDALTSEAPPSEKPTQSASAAPARTVPAEAPKARTPILPWAIAVAAVGGAIYFARRPAAPPPDLPQVQQQAPPVAAPPPPPVATTEPTAPSPATVAASAMVAATLPSSAPAAVAKNTAPSASASAKASQPQQPRPQSSATASAGPVAPAASAAASAQPAASAPAASAAAPEAERPPFDKDAATAALQASAAEAAACRKEGDPSGRAVVHVTFTNTGHAIRATVEGPPFAGTATGGCIAQAMRKATVPPFSGDKVTVAKTVNVD